MIINNKNADVDSFNFKSVLPKSFLPHEAHLSIVQTLHCSFASHQVRWSWPCCFSWFSTIMLQNVLLVPSCDYDFVVCIKYFFFTKMFVVYSNAMGLLLQGGEVVSTLTTELSRVEGSSNPPPGPCTSVEFACSPRA